VLRLELPLTIDGMEKARAHRPWHYDEPSHGYELVRQEVFGTSVIRLVRLLKCQQHPIAVGVLLFQAG
jgi:hypothetical protein